MADGKDNRWRNLGIIVALIIIFLAVLFLFNSFSLTTSDISVAWKELGVDSEYLHTDVELLMGLPDESLVKLRDNLIQFNSVGVGPNKELSLIYIDLVDIVILKKRAQQRYDLLIESTEEICLLVDDYSQLVDEMQNIATLLLDLSEKQIIFIEKYPEYSEEIELFGLSNGALSFGDGLELQSELVNTLVEECK
jgi:carboxylesterase type B